MEAGKYRGKAIGYAIGRASTGTEQVGISFEMQVGEGKEYITWYGYFSEATAERTIKTLHTLGLAHDDLDKIAEDGSDFPNEVELDIQRDEKGYLKVAWVNRVGAGVAMKDVMNPAEKMAFAQRMKGLSLSLRGNTPRQAPRQAPKPVAAAAAAAEKPKFGNDFPVDDDDSQIPF